MDIVRPVMRVTPARRDMSIFIFGVILKLDGFERASGSR